MTFPEVSFVAGPSEDADVRLDLNSAFGLASCRVEHDSFTLGAPPLLGEPDSVSAALGLRSAGWTLRITGPKSAAYDVRTLVSRELLRPTNWVRVRLSETSPVHYMQTYRGEFGALSLEFVRKGSASDPWRLPVNLAADPFLYSERVTLETVTLGNALDAANPLRYVLPPIEGDAPVGLRVSISPQGSGGYSASWLLACVSGDATMTDPTYDIGTGDFWGSIGSYLSSPTSSSTYLGGSYRKWENPVLGDSGMTGVFSGTLSPIPEPGRYRAFLRTELDPVDSSTPETYIFRLVQPTGAGLIRCPDVTVTTPSNGGTAYTFQGWVDLGEVAFPASQPSLPADVPLVLTAPQLALYISKTADVKGVARLDAIKLVPTFGSTVRQITSLDLTTEVVLNDAIAGSFDATMTLSVDSDDAALWKVLNSTGDLLPVPGIAEAGMFPLASPGADRNVLLCFPLARGASSSSSAATAADATWDLDISYHPRKLHI